MSKKQNSITPYDKNDEISNVANPLSILNNPGDNMSARVTDNNRKVLKVEINNGKNKYSKTQYPNGTTVETKTTKQ